MTDSTLNSARLLIVSSQLALLRSAWSVRETNPWHMETVEHSWEAMCRLQSEPDLHLVVLDVSSSEKDGLQLLGWLRRTRPDLPAIVIYFAEDANTKEEAIRLGAREVLTRPVSEHQLEESIRGVLDSADRHPALELVNHDVAPIAEEDFLLSVGPLMQQVRAQAELLAQSNVPVLILGERGCGKLAVARFIHKLSVYSGFRFSRVNCAAMPKEMLEAELFGRSSVRHDSQGSQGLMENANPGTLLLEELAEMPLPIQGKLLRVLQDMQAGHTDGGEVPSRIVATSSADLSQAVAKKSLQEDLYYLFRTFTIHVPSLRQRKDEIEALLRYTMHSFAKRYGLPAREFTQKTLDASINYSWPGNLPEMQGFVKRYLVAGEARLNCAEPFSSRNSARTSAPWAQSAAEVPPHSARRASLEDPTSLKSLIEGIKSDAEKKAIAVTLEKTGGNRRAAARLLRVSYRTLLYKVERYQIGASKSKSDSPAHVATDEKPKSTPAGSPSGLHLAHSK